jgi:general secretion pathway protein B
MSYILEALKKAQAERQLGSTPTIHALPIHPTTAGAESRSRKSFVWLIGVACITGVFAVGVAGWFRPAPAPEAPAPAPQVVQVPAPVQTFQPPVPMPVPSPAPVAAVRVPPPAPVAVAPKPAPPPAPVLAAQPEPAPAPAPEEVLPTQRELPDALQRELPPVTFGGYIYSSNPADRLLLIDKVLRREGEDVAPGLRLEKLLPKAAVMNFRGTRYRVPY